MHNHANLLLRLYGIGRGQAAEYWGSDYLASDQEICLFNVAALAKTQYKAQDPVFKPYLDAFVAGVNAYASLHPEAIGDEFKKVLPVKAEEVLEHGIRLLVLEFRS